MINDTEKCSCGSPSAFQRGAIKANGKRNVEEP